jgi:hypothetical protein
MKTSLWLVSILVLVGGNISFRSSSTGLWSQSWQEGVNKNLIRENAVAQVLPPAQQTTPETPYPVEGGTSMVGIIIGVVVIVLVVLGGVIFAVLTRSRDN